MKFKKGMDKFCAFLALILAVTYLGWNVGNLSPKETHIQSENNLQLTAEQAKSSSDSSSNDDSGTKGEENQDQDQTDADSSDANTSKKQDKSQNQEQDKEQEKKQEEETPTPSPSQAAIVPLQYTQDDQESEEQDGGTDKQDDSSQDDQKKGENSDKNKEGDQEKKSGNQGSGTGKGGENTPTATPTQGQGKPSGTPSPTSGGTTPTPTPGGEEEPKDDSEPVIMTNLANKAVTYNELTNDQLSFYAYLENPTDSMTLQVKFQGNVLSSEDGQNYQITLKRKTDNVVTLLVKQSNKTIETLEYHIIYQEDKADEEHPEQGDNPPSIKTNLDNRDLRIGNRNFTLTVTARDYKNKVIPASNLEVRMDGKRITAYTGSKTFEYQLYFNNPDVGDEEEHTISVLAWDNEGNSRYVSYKVTYVYQDTGAEIGTAYIVLDATTVGLDIMEEAYPYRIKQDEPASYAVVAMLEDCGYDIQYGGTLDNGFYLKRISRGGMMDGAEVPKRLWDLVVKDGLTQTNQSYTDSLGEFDFFQGSGWMFSVGGELYAGKGLSEYYLSDGDTLYLRFTLSYGKDIGGYSSTGGQYGSLEEYCGKWINGQDIVEHQWNQMQITKEASCTEEGEESAACKICGEMTDNQIIPALGHDYQIVSETDADCTQGGSVTYQCSRCGDSYEETTEALDHDYQAVENVDATETEDGYILYRCSRCGEEYQETIPATGSSEEGLE